MEKIKKPEKIKAHLSFIFDKCQSIFTQ